MLKEHPENNERNFISGMSMEDMWKKYEFIINTSKEFLSLINNNYTYEAVNDSFCKAHSKLPSDIIGKTVSHVFGEKIFKSITKIYLDKCFAGHEVHYQERVELPKLGERYFDVSYYPYKNELTGSISHAVVVARDITERKRNEDEIQHAHSLISLIFENIPHAIFIKGARDYKFVQFNRSAEELLGYSKEVLIGKNDYDIFPAQRADQLREKDKEVVKSRKLVDIPEEIIETKDKTIRILHTKKLPILDEDGIPQYIMGIAEDITEKKSLENALRESEEKYKKLFEESKDVIMIFRPDGVITDINPAGLELFGYRSLTDILKVNYFTEICSFDAEAHSFVSLIEQHGFLKDFDMNLRKLDGHKLFVQITAIAVHKNKNVNSEYRCILRDITDRRKIEQQLLQSQKMESLGILAGGISHEFNNLLTGILGYASFIKSNIKTGDKLFEGVQTIEDNARRAASLTTQLLTFARGGKYKLKSVNLNHVVKETLKIITSTFDKSIEVESNLYSGLPAVNADSSQLQQALMNICINARDAMPKGGKLTIMTGISMITEDFARDHTEIRPGSYVTLTVTDTGAGIEPDTMDNIFEPFVTTKDGLKSIGIGMFMSYGIIKNHNGFINVYSEPGEGATFEIYLPATQKTEDIEESKLPAIEIPRGTETIMVVDDEKYIRSFVKSMLETYGYKVMLAESGHEAIDIYRNHYQKIDLVILDLIMPKLSGYESYLKLKEINHKIKAIFSSGLNQDTKANEAIRGGNVEFIQKPFQINEIMLTLRNILDKRK